MITKHVVEHLLAKDTNYRELFQLLNVLNKKRLWGSSIHPELNNVLDNFTYDNLNNIRVIMVCGIIQKIFIFDNNKEHRARRCLPVLIIHGNESYVANYSKTKAIAELNSVLTLKDFFPDPFSKKIIYINNLHDIKPIVFSEYTKKEWTLEDPMILDVNKPTNTISSKIIIRNLLEDFI